MSNVSIHSSDSIKRKVAIEVRSCGCAGNANYRRYCENERSTRFGQFGAVEALRNKHLFEKGLFGDNVDFLI